MSLWHFKGYEWYFFSIYPRICPSFFYDHLNSQNGYLIQSKLWSKQLDNVWIVLKIPPKQICLKRCSKLFSAKNVEVDIKRFQAMEKWPTPMTFEVDRVDACDIMLTLQIFHRSKGWLHP